ncbi:MAG: ECF transporter S component [Bacillota bacterium]|nr:ECF transporter S component [Bacillota bacterium]
MRAREIVLGALLTALALLIPLAFRGWLQVTIPPFSATLGSHVPSFFAIFISPWVAGMVGLASSLGFLFTLGPVVAARAFIHVIFGITGALLYRGGLKPWLVLLAILPIHALGEALVVLPFGFDLAKAGLLVGVGTALHHAVDGLIALSLLGFLRAFRTSPEQ